MIELTTPRSADPQELHRWIMDFIQRFMAEQRTGGGISGVGGEAGTGVVSGGATWWPLLTPPDGYVALSGQLLDQSSFPVLYSTYGLVFNVGGEAAGTFRLPNMNGRLPKHGTSGTGGAASLVLGLEHLPELELPIIDPGHTHDFTSVPHTHSVTDPQHAHAVPGTWLATTDVVGVAAGATDIPLGVSGAITSQNAATGVTINNATGGGTNSEETTGLTVSLPGGGEAIDIDPPWLGGLWIVRAE